MDTVRTACGTSMAVLWPEVVFYECLNTNLTFKNEEYVPLAQEYYGPSFWVCA